MVKKFGAIVVLVLISTTLTALSPWAEQWGADSPYSPPRYISGFGRADRDDYHGSDAEAREAARSRALADLTEKVRVHVRTELVSRTEDAAGTYSASLSDAVSISTTLDLASVGYETEEQRGVYYVLAWADLGMLEALQEENGRRDYIEFRRALEEVDREIRSGSTAAAERAINAARTAQRRIEDARLLWTSLHRLTGRTRDDDGYSRGADIPSVGELSLEISSRSDRLQEYRPDSLAAAAWYLAEQTGDGTVVTNVLPLVYRDSGFTSTFGSRFGERLFTACRQTERRTGTGADDRIVLSGTYWPGESEILIQLRGRDIENGRVIAAVDVSIPPVLVTRDDLIPPNADAAMADGTTLFADSVTGGGIALDAWTNKGRNEDVLVFEKGEDVQFYFRVDQPAYLRLTYTLASGEKVLLEPSFYIGSHQVNRIVELPYEFEVVPPFGVERLVVTATSDEPEASGTVPKVIDGETYEVFSSAEAIVARTRGLTRRRQEGGGSTRTGEATLTITTIGE